MIQGFISNGMQVEKTDDEGRTYTGIVQTTHPEKGVYVRWHKGYASWCQREELQTPPPSPANSLP